MELGISNLAWDPKNRLEVYDYLNVIGIKKIEIVPGLFFFKSSDKYSPTRKELFSAVSEIERKDLSIFSMQSLLYGKKNSLLFGNNKQRESFKYELLKCFDLAHKLKISSLVFGSPLNRIVPKDMSKKMSEEIALETFSYLGDELKGSDSSLCIEFNPKIYGTNFITNQDEAYDFVKKIKNNHIKIVFDVGCSKVNQEFDDKAGSWIKKAINMIGHVHLSEPHLKPAPKTVQSCKYLIDLLSKNKYKGGVSLEMKSLPNKNFDNIKSSLSKILKAIK